jgi:hypothetical protein
MENIIIKNDSPLRANTLLMYIIKKGDIYKLPHMNGINNNYPWGTYNKQKRKGEMI